MFHLVRYCLALSLCCLVAAGSIPAVLHIAQHEAAAHDSRVSKCSHCCCEHHAADKSQDGSEGKEGDSQHDHDNCRLCQLLFTLFTPTEADQGFVTVESVAQTIFQLPKQFCFNSDILVHDSRGPPASCSC